MAGFDIPWTPFFLFGIAIFHPWLAMLAVSGGAVLIVVAIANQVLTRLPQAKSNLAGFQSEAISEQIRSEAEMIRSLGMTGAAFDRWSVARRQSLEEQLRTTDLGGGFSSLAKSLRLFLQSAMLGLGAYLVLQNELTGGAMIAGSILFGRAPLPRPKARLEAQNVTIIPPGEQQAALRAVNFVIEPGVAVGVIGQSGAGKSTLARAITGVWPPAAGKIRLDGAALVNYAPDVLGQHIGYLP